MVLPEKSRKHNEELSHGLTAARGEKGGTDLCPSNLIYATLHREGGITAVQAAKSPEKSPTPSRKSTETLTVGLTLESIHEQATRSKPSATGLDYEGEGEGVLTGKTGEGGRREEAP